MMAWTASCLFWLLSTTLIAAQNVSCSAPTVTIKNGSYYGRYEPSYGVEYFLGMPFAQPPVGSLRFRVPQSLNGTWGGTRNATHFGPECIGYGGDTIAAGNRVSEDCLTINVVKSHGSGANLPVVIWIHGGGFVMGGAADPRYNQTFMVHQAALAGTPILAVSINYRLSAWGFIYGKEFQESGNTNLGFRDQRLALHWVQENIAAFGGDPNKVTIMGESAGGISVGVQLLAYNGRDDKLFAGAISESGNPATAAPYGTFASWAPVIANISAGVGCQNSTQLLDCLRAVPVQRLNAVINSTATAGAVYTAVIDGDLVAKAASVQLQEGSFVRVPFLLGTNTDEGTSFGPRGINTTDQFLEYCRRGTGARAVDNTTATDLAILYPDIPVIGIPATLPGRPNGSLGSQFKRTSALAGDFSMQAPRRIMSEAWARFNATSYSYLFNVVVNGVPYYYGSPHFQEVAFVFYNTMGLGYPATGVPNPLGGPNAQTYQRISRQMVQMWISFISFADPNYGLDMSTATWPRYTLDAPQNYVFEQNTTAHAEADTYRAEAIYYINRFAYARRGRNCTDIVDCGS